MVIYHFGFSVDSYLIAKIHPEAREIPCDPLTDTEDRILGRLDGDKDLTFHIDLSVQHKIPPRRARILRALAAAGVKIHNASYADQRKGHLQVMSRRLGLPSLTAKQKGDPDELLMVKSDLNVAGGPERRSVARIPGLPIPPLPTGITSAFQYYVAKRKEIAPRVWKDASLHVERFIENSEGLVLRTFWNRGRVVVSKIKNPVDVIKKRNAPHPRWNYAEPVDDLTNLAFARTRRYAEGLGLSFFAADWVVDAQGNPFLVDLNLTPQWLVDRAAQKRNMTPDFHMADIPERLRHKRAPCWGIKAAVNKSRAKPRIVIITSGAHYQEAAAWSAPTYARHPEHRGRVTVLLPKGEAASRLLKSHARKFDFSIGRFPFLPVSEAKLTSQLKCQAGLFVVSDLKPGEFVFFVDADTCCYKPLEVPREVEAEILSGRIGLVPDIKDRHFQSPEVPWYLHPRERLPYVNSGVIVAAAPALDMFQRFCEFSKQPDFLHGPFNDQKIINFALGRYFRKRLTLLDAIYNQIGAANWTASTVIQHFAGGAGNLGRHSRKFTHQEACAKVLA